LVARHVAFGKTPDAAREWVDRVDEANARAVAATRDRADLVLDLTGWDGTSYPPGIDVPTLWTGTPSGRR
jgi:hypothetical protein